MNRFSDDEAARYQRLLKEDGQDMSLDEAREAAQRVQALVEMVVEILRDPVKRREIWFSQKEKEIKILSSQDGQLAILLLKRGPGRGRRNL